MLKIDKNTFNKILVNHFGAIRPSWISKHVFYKLPFNFCDRWCERCGLQKICRVYQKENERKKNYLKKGIDPDSPKGMFLSIFDTFTEIKSMLKKDMQLLNISKDDIDQANIQRKQNIDQAETNDLYILSKDISIRLSKIYEDIEYYVIESPDIRKQINEEMQILVYYMHFFTAKIYRAISGSQEFENDQDSTHDDKTSAFLAGLALQKIIKSLQTLTKFKKFPVKILARLKKMELVCTELLNIVDLRFEIFKISEICGKSPGI